MSNESSIAPAAATPKSKLNPFAREFKLNVNAPSFTPTSKPSSLQGSATPFGGAGQGSRPASAASQAPAGPRSPYTCLICFTGTMLDMDSLSSCGFGIVTKVIHICFTQ